MSLYADFEHRFLLIFFILLQLLRVFPDHRSSIVGRCKAAEVYRYLH